MLRPNLRGEIVLASVHKRPLLSVPLVSLSFWPDHLPPRNDYACLYIMTNSASTSSTTASLPLHRDLDGGDEEEVLEFSSSPPAETSPTPPTTVTTTNTTAPHHKAGGPLNDAYTRREQIFVVIVGLLLSFNAGFVNGVCLSGMLTESGATASVGGFTGGYTRSALILASAEARMVDLDEAGFLFSLLFFYVVGSFLAGLITPRPKPWTIAPTYGPTFLLGSALLTAASLMAALEVNAKHVFQLAAAANGVQIGTSSMYSANLIRSAHLTGSSTDMGLFAGQVCRGNYTNLWKLQILLSISIFFWVGSLIAFFATRRLTHYTLLFNASLYFVLGMALIYFLVRNLHISLKEAILGTWQWGKAFESLKLVGNDGGAVSDEDLMAIFDKIDVNGDGGLQEDELFAALKEAGLPGLNLKTVQRMMQEADDNGDGEICRDEWKVLVHGYFDKKDLHRTSSMRSSMSPHRRRRGAHDGTHDQEQSP